MVQVKCEACGCYTPYISGVCPHCGAALSHGKVEYIGPVKSDKDHPHKIKYGHSLDIKYTDRPNFDQELWIGLYDICFRIGECIAQMCNRTNMPTVSYDLRRKYVQKILLDHMIRCGNCNRQAKELQTDICDPIVRELQAYPGWNSVGKGIDYDWSGIYYMSPVTAGYLTTSDGEPFNNLIGSEWRLIEYDIYYKLECLQELYLLMNSPVDTIMSEQYIQEFESTRVAMYFRDKSNGFFATSAFIDWDKSPKKFYDLLRNEKYAKKLAKDLGYGVLDSSEKDKMRKYTRGMSGSVSKLPDLLDDIDRYVRGKRLNMLGLGPKDAIDASSELHQRTGLNDLIIER